MMLLQATEVQFDLTHIVSWVVSLIVTVIGYLLLRAIKDRDKEIESLDKRIVDQQIIWDKTLEFLGSRIDSQKDFIALREVDRATSELKIKYLEQQNGKFDLIVTSIFNKLEEITKSLHQKADRHEQDN
jgi:hypothetical protein